MRTRTKTNYKLIAAGAAAAGVAGYLVGALSRPKKKEKAAATVLKKVGDTNIADVEKQLSGAYKELTKLVATAKTGAKDASTKKEFITLLATAKDNKDKAAEVLSTLKSGTANDKDLKKAIKDARNSINHLKDFIKK